MRITVLTSAAALAACLFASASAQTDGTIPPPLFVEPWPGAPVDPPLIGDPSPAAPAPALPGVSGRSGDVLVPDAAPMPEAPAIVTDAPEPTMQDLDPAAVNSAVFAPGAEHIHGASPLILKAQVLLDRAGASPGVIDSYYGENVAKAIAAVESVLDLPVDGLLDQEVWTALGGDHVPPVLMQYTITEEDVAGPYVAAIPADYSEQAAMESLAYTGPVEMLAERFHMDADLLVALNPGVHFDQVGASIVVASIAGQPITGMVVRIDVDKRLKQLRAYDAAGRLVVAYPATIGSADNPSPAGDHTVREIVPDPWYSYDPDNFVQGDNMEKLSLPPGPNNPVGNIWIALSEPGYGIHGTPEPSRIDKTGSHGCIRLTNWDAAELANLVQPGVPVSFIE